MPLHDWMRVDAGTFHHFHTAWIVHLSETLNSGILPEGYYSLAEQHAGRTIPDVLTLKTEQRAIVEPVPQGMAAVEEAPPQVSLTMVPDEANAYRTARRTLVIRHVSGHQIVALVEIVSPRNKDRARSVRDLVEKALSALQQGIHLLVIDLFPPGPSDPQGMHGAIWSEIADQVYEPPPGRPLTLAAYAADLPPRAYVEPLAVGTELPPMPLFLTPSHYVTVPLEPGYMAAYRGVPEVWRRVIEGNG